MKISTKNILIPLLLILSTFIFISGCAYFNMYYNAKEHFNKAEKVRIQQNKIDRKGYEDSIKELSKILEFYPDHELVDDALLMMGKCYYRKSNYSKAKRKYQELISNFKDSELVAKAKLGIAEVEIAKKNFEEADMMIKEIGKGEIGEDSYEVKRLFADLSIALGDSTIAMERYLEASKKSNTETEELENLKIAADLAAEIRAYSKAAELYQSIFEKSSTRKDLFDYKLKFGQMIQNQDYIDSAIVIYNELINNEEYAVYSLEAEVILARLFFSKNEFAKTYEQLEEILRINDKTKENEKILAEVAFYLGEYFLKVDRDLVTSKMFFDSVTYFYKDSKDDLIKKTNYKKKVIKKYDSLRTFFYNYPFLKDSLSEKLISIKEEISELNNIEDTLRFRNKSSGKKDIELQLSKMEKKFIFANFSLAELFRYDLDYIDSSVVYLEKVKNMKKYPHMASRAYLIEAYIYKDIYEDKAIFENYLDSVFMMYPSTKVSNHIREIRGIEKVIVIEDTASYLYNKASQDFLDSNYAEAFIKYLDIVDRFSESSIAPKVLKSAAILQEDYIGDTKLEKELAKKEAKKIYKRLSLDYEKSIEARFAQKKLRDPEESTVAANNNSGEVAKEKEEVTSNKDSKTDKKNLSTQDRWYLMDRRNE